MKIIECVPNFSEGKNEEDAAKKLGLIKWDGWKKGGVLTPLNLNKEKCYLMHKISPEETAHFERDIKDIAESSLLAWEGSWFASSTTRTKFFGSSGNGRWVNFVKLEPANYLTKESITLALKRT